MAPKKKSAKIRTKTKAGVKSAKSKTAKKVIKNKPSIKRPTKTKKVVANKTKKKAVKKAAPRKKVVKKKVKKLVKKTAPKKKVTKKPVKKATKPKKKQVVDSQDKTTEEATQLDDAIPVEEVKSFREKIKKYKFPPEIEHLLLKGHDQNFITQQALNQAIPDAEKNIELLDKLYESFFDLGIEVVDLRDDLIWQATEGGETTEKKGSK
ncbi:MAG: RNA polymerase sigma factor region1.1 domain-containing protein, partial [Patescibacteria group bacterium]|nr:RNA polymerase sigma factor region1.1 domain-containing protein [Patescibacteria group bacterium]